MRHELAGNIVKLAVALQGARRGLTLNDIQDCFGVKRKTAERMRNTVEMIFGPLEIVESSDRRKHWRLRSSFLRHIVGVRVEEIKEFESAVERLARSGLDERANHLRNLLGKLYAATHPAKVRELDAQLAALRQTENAAKRLKSRRNRKGGGA